MKGYKFRLQKLLDMRMAKEDEAKRKFQDAQKEKNIVEVKLNNLEENYRKFNVTNKKESVIEQKIRYHYLNALTYSIRETEEELKKKEQIVEEHREVLNVKQIERKTVEKLKEKDMAAFIKEQELLEQKSNDEFALYGYIRNVNERGEN